MFFVRIDSRELKPSNKSVVYELMHMIDATSYKSN